MSSGFAPNDKLKEEEKKISACEIRTVLNLHLEHFLSDLLRTSTVPQGFAPIRSSRSILKGSSVATDLLSNDIQRPHAPEYDSFLLSERN